MSVEAVGPDPFVTQTQSRLVEASPRRAVVEQPAAAALDNHVGVRHASALHAAGYEASRALLSASLDGPGRRDLSLVESEIEYTAVGLGPLTTVAEPAGDNWTRLGDLTEGGRVTLDTAVTTSDAEGKPVARLRLSWSVSAGGG